MGETGPAEAGGRSRPYGRIFRSSGAGQAQAVGQKVMSFPQYRENAFDFLDAFYGPAQPVDPVAGGGLRMVYSYFAVYGDPLMDREIDPYPEALLAQYAAQGVNGIWLQGILYQLTPFPFAPELSSGLGKADRRASCADRTGGSVWDRRISLSERAQVHGRGLLPRLSAAKGLC